MANVPPHRILTGSSRPHSVQALTLHPQKEKLIEEEEDKLIQAGVVSKTSGPWCSPVVLARKKDGSIRFCVNYQLLNLKTLADSYPLPNPEHCLSSLSGADYFTSLDCKAGYWQIPVDPRDRDKTAFRSRRHGLLAFNVLPFGLSNAPASFARAMDAVVSGVSCSSSVLAYLDDILIFTHGGFDLHLKHVEEVLERLEQCGFTVNPAKVKFARRSLEFLGPL